MIVYDTKFIGDKSTFSHEMIHIFQYYDYNFLSKLTKKPIDNLFKNSNFYQKSSNYFYSDIEGALLLRALYLAEYKVGSRYYENFFEREAGIYTNTIRKFN